MTAAIVRALIAITNWRIERRTQRFQQWTERAVKRERALRNRLIDIRYPTMRRLRERNGT